MTHRDFKQHSIIVKRVFNSMTLQLFSNNMSKNIKVLFL